MVDRASSALSVSRQSVLLGVSRRSVYYTPRGASDFNLRMMRAMDEQYLSAPWYGSRQMVRVLRRMGYGVGRKRVRRGMRVMGLRSLAPGPSTSRRSPAHPVYPYLLRELSIDRPGQVWCADVTYIPMARGFLYLVAVMDWYSRRVLAWKLSTTQDTDFCLEALQDALDRQSPRRSSIPTRACPRESGGKPVHQPGLDGSFEGLGHSDFHGWQRPVAGQCVYRAAVAIA